MKNYLNINCGDDGTVFTNLIFPKHDVLVLLIHIMTKQSYLKEDPKVLLAKELLLLTAWNVCLRIMEFILLIN